MSGAISVPRRFTQLFDTPNSLAGHALKVARVNAAENSLEFAPINIDPFAWAADWVNVLDYNAAGVITTTTLAAQLDSGSTSATLTDASSFEAGHGMAIPGAGGAGAELAVVLTDVTGNVVSWTGATSTTVASGTTVHHDDTQAFLDAIDTAKHVYAPWGNYNVTDTLTLDTYAGQCLMGGGDEKTRIYHRSLTKDCIVLVKVGTSLRRLMVIMDASLTPTSGAGVVVGKAGSFASVRTYVNEVSIVNTYDGLRTENTTSSSIYKVVIADPRRYGWYSTSGTPTGGCEYSDIIIYLGSPSWRAGVVAGFYMDKGDTTRYNNISFFGFPKNAWIRSTAGQISTQIFTGFTNESGAGTSDYSIYLEKGAYDFLSVCFTGGEVLLGNIYVGAGVEDTNLVGITVPCYPVGSNGVHIYGKNTKLLAVHFGSTANSTNSYDGIKIYSGANGTQILGCAAKKRRYGLTVENGALNTIIQGNNFLDNNTAAYSFGSTVRENSRISGNYGIEDYGSFIASTPGYVGQEALSGGHFYKAVGTSSSADWKQITA